MELTTFGAVLKFALDQEAALAGFCAAAAAASGEPLRDILSDLAVSGDTNRRKLEQIRRQQVNEMLLEAIQGLDTDDYQLGLAAGNGRAAVTSAEAKLECFYRDAAARLSLPEAVRSFAKLADGHAQALSRLTQG
jgi:hypothetical protein